MFNRGWRVLLWVASAAMVIDTAGTEATLGGLPYAACRWGSQELELVLVFSIILPNAKISELCTRTIEPGDECSATLSRLPAVQVDCRRRGLSEVREARVRTRRRGLDRIH